MAGSEQSELDSDTQADRRAHKFLEQLKKIGPFSKQILNYSYPPLLYQRGEDEEDGSAENEGECDEDEEEEEYNSHMMDEMEMDQLPQLNDSDDEDHLLGIDHGFEIEVGDDDAILNRLKSLGEDSLDEQFRGRKFKGGNATNLDELDKDEMHKLINQQCSDSDSEH